MCEQCLARVIDIASGEFIPDWFLVMATCDGSNIMKRGDYGLGQINDPDFVIPAALKPTVDPVFDLTDEQIDAMSEEEDEKMEVFHDLVDSISKHLFADPITGYELVTACKAAGWDPEKHGWDLAYWLTHKMGEAIAKFEQKEWPDGPTEWPYPIKPE